MSRVFEKNFRLVFGAGPCYARPMTAIITQTPEGFDVTVEFDNGFSETIEGLYDIDSAFSFVRMHHAFQTNKYIRP